MYNDIKWNCMLIKMEAAAIFVESSTLRIQMWVNPFKGPGMFVHRRVNM